MSAAIRTLWRHIPHWPVPGFACRREAVPAPPEPTSEIPFRFKESEENRGPSAEELEAKEHECADWFRRDQLLPIMGWSCGVPG